MYLRSEARRAHRLVDDAAAGRRAARLGHGAINFYDDGFLIRVDPVHGIAKTTLELVVARGASMRPSLSSVLIWSTGARLAASGKQRSHECRIDGVGLASRSR